MKGARRGWILIPVVIIAAVVLGVVLSRYQKEMGLSEAGKGGVVAVAAASAARDLALGEGQEAFATFSDAYLVAQAAYRNAATSNATDTRLEHLLVEITDCLAADREAWQAQIERSWDPEAQGIPAYWKTMHPAILPPSSGTLTPADVRRISVERANALLKEAVAVAS